MQAAGHTDAGRVREDNQDCFALREELGLAVLADGMGGARAGGVASELAVDAALDHLVGVRRRGAIEAQHLHAAVRVANTRVLGMANAVSAYRGMGTTLVVTVVEGAKGYVAHVGDSRAYRYRSGSLTQLTTDHSVVQEWVDAGVISVQEARHAPNRNVITRAIGAKGTLHADVSELELAGGDLLLLCSDGLTGMLTDAEIAAALAGEDDLAQAASTLVAAANAAGGTDNVTAVLIRC